MLLVYRHTLIVLYICICIACFVGDIVWATLLFNNASRNPSDSSEYIITINDISLKLLKGVCIILNLMVIPVLLYFFYSYRKTLW